MTTDYYAALGVSPDASDTEIKQAFRTLAREHHPDATGGDADSEQRYKEVSEAYAVLSDPAKRQQYDAARMGVGTWSSPWSSPFASTIEDIFETFFGGSATAERGRGRRGGAIEVELTVTLSDALDGGTKTLTYDRFASCERCSGSGSEPGTEPERCDACRGTGQVQQTRRTVLGSLVTAYPCAGCRGSGWIVRSPCTGCQGHGRVEQEASLELEVPPGIDDGDRLRVTGHGEAGAAGGAAGDLYVRFIVEPDERFERVGDDLFTWVEIPMTTAALGGRVRVQTLDAEETVDVPAGTRSGRVFRFRKAGMPRRTGRGRGDLIARAHVLTPDASDDEQRRVLERLGELRGERWGKRAEEGSLRRVLDGDADR